MTRTRTRTLRLLGTAIVLPALALTACSSSAADGDAAAAGSTAKACDLPEADSSASLPDDFPTFDDITLYEPSTQGATQVVFGWLPEADFVEVRDSQVDKLKEAGYEIEGTDQESVEAEAEFKGAHEGTIKVQPLCEGHVSIRYKLNS